VSGPIVELIAGGGAETPALGVRALDAALQRPTGIAVGSIGSIVGQELWIVDANLGQLIRLSPDGSTITAVFGGLYNPQGVTAMPGRGPSIPYVADTSSYRVVMAADDGITRVAGDQAHAGYRGDGGPARRAWLWLPYDVASDRAGGLYIADTANGRIRFIDPVTGDIETVAGTGAEGFSGDGGPAIEAQLNNVQAIAVDADGTALFIADTDNGRLRRVDLATGIIDTVAGSGTGSVAFDPSLTGLQTPITRISALALDAAGNTYFPVFWGDLGPTIMRLDPLGTMTRIVGGGRLSEPGVAALDFALPDVLGLSVDYSTDALLISGSDGRVYRIQGVISSGT
jgi:DNA-binding beta-propeller fold protein YncE